MKHYGKLSLMILLLALLLAACGGGSDADQEAASGEEMGGMAMGEVPADLDTATTRVTDEGLYQVSIATEMEPLALNEIHAWTVHVETPDGQAVDGATIGVDGGMPQHNHGFPTTPQITEALGNGDYKLDGVKFSMAGWWELSLDIDGAAGQDSVTFNIVLP